MHEAAVYLSGGQQLPILPSLSIATAGPTKYCLQAHLHLCLCEVSTGQVFWQRLAAIRRAALAYMHAIDALIRCAMDSIAKTTPGSGSPPWLRNIAMLACRSTTSEFAQTCR